jgi:antibiotic biosynthesis monooxygenase (ABM) superfamily enzyme
MQTKHGSRVLLTLLVWTGIWPSATLLTLALRPVIHSWPIPMQTLSTTLILVPWMVYGVMPVVRRVLDRLTMSASAEPPISR